MIALFEKMHVLDASNLRQFGRQTVVLSKCWCEMSETKDSTWQWFSILYTRTTFRFLYMLILLMGSESIGGTVGAQKFGTSYSKICDELFSVLANPGPLWKVCSVGSENCYIVKHSLLTWVLWSFTHLQPGTMDTSLFERPSVVIPTATVFIWLCYLAVLAVYRLYVSPLAKFPGPKLAGLSQWYEFYYDVVLGGKFIFQIQKLHRIYGTCNRSRKLSDLTLSRTHCSHCPLRAPHRRQRIFRRTIFPFSKIRQIRMDVR